MATFASPPTEPPVTVAAFETRQPEWPKVALFAILLVLAFLPVVKGMVSQWYNDDDMGHGFFVPVVAAYIAWQRKDQVMAQRMAPNWLGLIPLIWGSFQSYVANLGAEFFLARTAIIFSVVGAVWLVCGTKVLKILAFPIALLCFMVPLPAVIYNQITMPLQFFASWVAEVTLNVIGYPVLREGNVLEMANNRLSVVEACSGIRSLLTLTFLSVVYGFFADNKAWMRVVLLIGVVPIAIFANSVRVTLTGIISEYNKEWAEGFFHTMEGWVIFMVAFVMLLGLHKLANGFYNMLERAKTEAPLEA